MPGFMSLPRLMLRPRLGRIQIGALPFGARLRMATLTPQAAKPEVDPTTKEWLVILPDNNGVLEKRIQIRPTHSKNFQRLHREGHVSWAGPVFSEPCVKKPDVEDRPFMGSVMVIRNTSRENIYRLLSTDLFITEGIWNWDKVQILPFRSVARTPSHIGSKW